MAENNNSYVLITGGTQGIGYELAKLFAADGYGLVLVSRTEEDLQARKQEFAGQVDVVTINKDLIDPDAPFEVYEEVMDRGLQIDILVNNAGQGQFGLFGEGDLERYLDIIQLNVSSLTALTHLFLQDMLERGQGRILQLASIASELPGPYAAVYHGTKAYVLSFTEALRSELKDTGITVTALQPGATATDFFNKADMLDSRILDTKLSDPADVARDGYEALMKGDDKVVSGLKNKLMTAAANVMPESTVADTMAKMQGPKE